MYDILIENKTKIMEYFKLDEEDFNYFVERNDMEVHTSISSLYNSQFDGNEDIEDIADLKIVETDGVKECVAVIGISDYNNTLVINENLIIWIYR